MSTTEPRGRPPLGVTFGSLGVLGPAAIVDIAQSAQAHGYSSIWTVEATGTDAFSMLGAVAHAAPGLDLATGIIPVQLRAPTLVAMTAATLQSLSDDRDVLVGLGVSAPGILRQHGESPTDRPIAMMREYVALLRECMSGEPVTFEGDFWQVRRFRLGVRLGERRPKIVLAALNPQMLRLAGEVADGVLLNYLPASHVPAAVSDVRAGGDAQIICYVHAAAGDLERSARSAQRDLLNYAMADGYANAFRAAGFGDEVDEARARQSERDREGALAAISNEMIQAIDFIGSPAEIGEFARTYVDAGVEHPVLMPLPWGEDRRAVADETMEAFANAFD
ncbi:LLM class F420-dependent oxidoreductase [Candidatus Poriferisodalis sp.]|uniref:LLM class F420-dependent oxidoreductase n=1 Tax=Candidatus Poriferisodalis sp. TaxID=3101277 RepID=UPI003C7015C1